MWPVFEFAARYVFWYLFYGAVHECAHLATAVALGCGGDCLTLSNAWSAIFGRSVAVPSLGKDGWERTVTTHAAWICSVSLALAVAGPAWSARWAAGS